MNIQPHWAYYTTVLSITSSNGPTSRKELREKVAESVSLPQSDFELENERGTNIFNSRVHWAVIDLVGVGALQRTGRGVIQITEFGLALMARFPRGLTRKEIEALPEWGIWKRSWAGKGKAQQGQSLLGELESGQTPDERLDSALDELNSNLAQELVRKIQSLKPVALEKIVLHLLHAMGYGDSEEAMVHLGGAGDEGVDGVINLDKLGLQKIYIQAKRYKEGSPITPTTIQAFIGALVNKRAVGGVFITTSDFTKAATEAAANSSLHVELINGGRLGELLIKHKVAVRAKQVIERSEIDEAYFEDLEV